MPFQVNNFQVLCRKPLILKCFLTDQPENLISENLYVIEKTNVPIKRPINIKNS
jgi:hypothetical protein